MMDAISVLVRRAISSSACRWPEITLAVQL